MAKEHARKAAEAKAIEDAEDEAERQRALDDKRKYDDLVSRTTREAKAADEENEDIKKKCAIDAKKAAEYKQENEILRLKLVTATEKYASDAKLFATTAMQNADLKESIDKLKAEGNPTSKNCGCGNGCGCQMQSNESSAIKHQLTDLIKDAKT